MHKIKVLIVDDSQLIRDVLTAILSADARLEVVGAAIDPYEARQMIKDLNPDVLTLDVEMPKMNGVAFLKNLMRLRPMPVVMISTLTSEGSNITMQALELGAIDFIEKPADLARVMEEYRQLIVIKVLAAASVKKSKLLQFQRRLTTEPESESAPAPEVHNPVSVVQQNAKPASKVVLIGGSTGSLEALKTLLLQVNFTGSEAILVALHLPGKFTASYAARLAEALPVKVKEAEQNEPVLEGHIYIAPGGRHLEIKKRGAGFQCIITDDEPVNLHRPSVDVLFDSGARNSAGRCMGMILTGMGRDGAEGLKHMRESGLDTYAQDEESSVVWGMPGSAVEIEAVESKNVFDLTGLAVKLRQYCN